VRKVAALVITLAVLSTVQMTTLNTAQAGETYICWYEDVWDPDYQRWVPGMKCRIDGAIHEPGFPGEPGDVTLVYDIGYDNVGECFYRRTGSWPGWVPLAVEGTRILFAYDPDGVPGGLVVGDAWFEQCISEPTPGYPPRTQVYDYLSQYTFAEPDPQLVPDGIGLAGATTHLFADPPPPVEETLVSPVSGQAIYIEIKVATVTIRWGDETEVTIPESQFDLFAPHPDGRVGHTWETMANYTMGVDYNWFVRWRVGSGPWNIIDIPATNWTEPYRVDEVVGRRRG